MTKIGKCAALVLAVTGAVALAAGAQVVREEARSRSPVNSTRSRRRRWRSRNGRSGSAGGEVLFASLDADIYRSWGPPRGRRDRDEVGKKDGWRLQRRRRAGLFRLKVLDAGATSCAPLPPGASAGVARDPRLAMHPPDLAQPGGLPAARGAGLRRRGGRGPFPTLPAHVSIRAIAPSGVNIQEAFARSGAGGF